MTTKRVHPLAIAAASFLVAGAIGCNTIVVNSTADENSSSSPDGNCTLREAVLAANTNAAVDGCIAGQSGADVIQLPAGTYALTIAGTDDTAQVGDLDVLQDLTIQGASAASTIVDASAVGDRVLDVVAGVTASLLDVTLRGGNVTVPVPDPAQGGGIRNAGALTLTRVTVTGNRAHSSPGFLGLAAAGEGGGIASSGTLDLENSVISDNVAEGAPGAENCFSLSCFFSPGGDAHGGGILSSGSLTIANSTVDGNLAQGGAGLDVPPGTTIPLLVGSSPGGAARGGAIVATGGSVAVTASTLSANDASAGRGGNGLVGPGFSLPGSHGGNGAGGALAADVTATLLNSTVTGNSAEGGVGGANGGAAGATNGGAITAGAALELRHVTLADSTGGASLAGGAGVTIANSIVSGTCAGIAGASLGGNVESTGDTCGLTEADDLFDVTAGDLALGALAPNGGPTQTRAIPGTSAAAGHGRDANCAPLDQRGVARPATGCDSGAYEAP